jgi:hypothetical protein
VDGQIERAGDTFRQALATAARIGRREILPEAHYRLGEQLARQGYDLAALAQFEAAAAEVETARIPLRAEELKLGLLGRWQQIYERLVLHCLRLDRVADAFAWAERARARAFVEWVLSARGPAPATETAAGPVSAADLAHALPPGGQALIYFTTGVLSRDAPLLAALAATGRLREHLLVPARTLLFNVSPVGLRAYDCGLDPNQLVQASPRGQDPELTLHPAILGRMGRKLLEPAGAPAADRHWYVAPHGPLHQVPFAALAAQASLPDQAPISLSYVPSAGLLYQSLSAPAATAPGASVGEALAVANPLPSGAAALVYAGPEAEQVAALLGGRAWVDAGPKREALRQAAARLRWLHFACHGWFDYDQPLASYLETGRGERLTAREIMFEWRLQADLVALSACRSGSSRILRGDEPFGLVRAFLAAGAGTVLVSQWAVDDFATFLLMGRLYQGHQEQPGLGWSGALAAAQHWLSALELEQARRLAGALPLPAWLAALPGDARPFSHPRYWAAFIVVGQDPPLPA